MILILEDNADRIERFRAAIADVLPAVPVRIWTDAHQMIADLMELLEHASLISLDHDLIQQPGAIDDPGSGYLVATLLEELIPVCPVIIHTSNSERGTWMEGALTRAGWKYRRVYPDGDDWIRTTWKLTVKRLLDVSQ